MSERGPIAVFIATSVTLAAYLFPYFYLPASWWRGIPSTFVIFVPAIFFAIAHHVVYRSGGVQIDWPAMLSIFSFAAIANTLFVRYRHIGYGFALHYAWNFYRFNSRYYLRGAPLSEGASFNYVEGDSLVVMLSLAVFVLVFRVSRSD